ncbi:MAG TPA: IPT/TIG domain-containing protein [Puia sp.]|nr:IPT/TIG domain-containing protein [Puia sp.]
MKKIHFLFLIFVVAILFGSCTKKNDLKDAGISYGITGVDPLVAASGDTISIYGAGFSSDTSHNTVTINGATAQVVSASPNLLQVIAPGSGIGRGNVKVHTGSQSATSTDQFTLATVISGDQTQSATWTPDNLYLLRGDVHFTKGAVLTIRAGTIILGEKTTNASLTFDDGAQVSMNGTTANPIVFTSNQAVQLRWNGDWKGITLASTSATTADHITYTRIEYAGSHPANQPGAALTINRAIQADSISYVQTSYSAGDGFRFAATDGSVQYLQYLIAAGCSGNDFSFVNNDKANAQFLFGFKDPKFADPLGADGLLVTSAGPVTISNLTLVGASGLARNCNASGTPSYGWTTIDNDVLNANAGRGVHVGGIDPATGNQLSGDLQLFNSVIAAPYLAGISLDGPATWAAYENGGTIIRHTSVTCLGIPSVDIVTPLLPLMGYVFSAENQQGPGSGFESVASMTQLSAFQQYNDSALLMQMPIPGTQVKATDDLGIKNMVLYANLSRPIVIPQKGSALYTDGDFSDAQLSDAFFDKSGSFRGAFAGTDWTVNWTNFAPQLTPYQ